MHCLEPHCLAMLVTMCELSVTKIRKKFGMNSSVTCVNRIRKKCDKNFMCYYLCEMNQQNLWNELYVIPVYTESEKIVKWTLYHVLSVWTESSKIVIWNLCVTYEWYFIMNDLGHHNKKLFDFLWIWKMRIHKLLEPLWIIHIGKKLHCNFNQWEHLNL